MTLASVTIVGRWLTADLAPASGYITLAPRAEATGAGAIIAPAPIELTLDQDGQVSATIASVDSVPTLQIQVTEHIVGAPVAIYVVTPTDPIVDLTQVPRGSLSAPTPLYVLASSVGVAGGLATLGEDGRLSTSQYPPSIEGADTWFGYTQSIPASVWTIPHNLGHVPAAVYVLDSTGAQIEGDRSDTDTNTTVVDLGNARTGYAYVS
jgi:hypothetical protein